MSGSELIDFLLLISINKALFSQQRVPLRVVPYSMQFLAYHHTCLHVCINRIWNRIIGPPSGVKNQYGRQSEFLAFFFWKYRPDVEE